MGRIRISIRSDGLAAEGAADAGAPATERDVRDALTAAGVIDGLDEAAIVTFVASLAGTAALPATVLARGKAQQAGTDGRLERTFASGKLVGRVHKDGHIDWRERDLLHPVAPGQVVARIVAPTPGIPGTDVRGRALPAKPGRPHTVRLGPGVNVEGSAVTAARPGVVLDDPRALDVVPLWEHGGDVDLRSGNLHTEGSLSVRGEIADGAAVEAAGDVVIAGSVQHGSVVAGGSASVGGGVLAASVVRAGASIACRHATSSRLEAGGDVDLRDAATHSDVRGEHIRITNGHGAAVGGALRARQSITLVTAGTAMGVSTTLAVADLLDASAALVRGTNVDTKVGRAAQRELRGADGPGGRAARVAMKSQDQAQEQRLQILQRRRNLLEAASITITGTLHAGVRIRFGELCLAIDEPRTRVRFRWDAANHRILEEHLP